MLGLRAPGAVGLLLGANWRLACGNGRRCRFSVPVPLLRRQSMPGAAFARSLLAASLFALTGASSQAAADASLEGYWLTKGFVIHISRCGEAYCGELVGLNKNRRPDDMRLDRHNKDASQRDRPLCGIDLFGGFRPSNREAGKWEGGWIYNPDDGKTYSSEVRTEGPNTLKARGYVLVPVIGRDITLVRESHPTVRCQVKDTVTREVAEPREQAAASVIP
jgi:uncharacterized protein (DUF2147 family)